MAKEQLKVGQKVWLEIGRFFSNPREKTLSKEMIVTKANKTSAYITNDTGKLEYKVNQRTHEVDSRTLDGCYYRLWLSKEKYEQNEMETEETKKLKKKLHNAIDEMPLRELKTTCDLLFK